MKNTLPYLAPSKSHAAKQSRSAAALVSTLERFVQKVFVRDQLTSSVIGHAKKKINIINKIVITNFKKAFMNYLFSYT